MHSTRLLRVSAAAILPRLRLTRDVTNRPEQEWPERAPIRIHRIEHSALAKARDEHLLHGVIDFLKEPRSAPACTDVGADHRSVLGDE